MQLKACKSLDVALKSFAWGVAKTTELFAFCKGLSQIRKLQLTERQKAYGES
jgi:hypothetical protein